MKPLIILTAIALLIFTIQEVEYNFRIKKMEQAYFEGQKDALNGDVRIRKNGDSCYIWIKSPWNNGSKPVFNPSNK